MNTKVLVTIFVFMLAIGSSAAQLKTGVKAGLSSFLVNTGELTILDSVGTPEYTLGVLKSSAGLHVGFFVQANFGKVFFIQSDLVFNIQSVKYLFKTVEEPISEFVKSENYQTLDIPAILGFRIGPVRFGAGPLARLFMNLNSDIDDVVEGEEFLSANYEARFRTLSWGWQAGVGMDIWQLHLDLRYEGNFEEFGNHMNYYGRNYSFGVTPERLIMSVGISF